VTDGDVLKAQTASDEESTENEQFLHGVNGWNGVSEISDRALSSAMRAPKAMRMPALEKARSS
jgi:hypothetical protein